MRIAARSEASSEVIADDAQNGQPPKAIAPMRPGGGGAQA